MFISCFVNFEPFLINKMCLSTKSKRIPNLLDGGRPHQQMCISVWMYSIVFCEIIFRFVIITVNQNSVSVFLLSIFCIVHLVSIDLQTSQWNA